MGLIQTTLEMAYLSYLLCYNDFDWTFEHMRLFNTTHI